MRRVVAPGWISNRQLMTMAADTHDIRIGTQARRHRSVLRLVRTNPSCSNDNSRPVRGVEERMRVRAAVSSFGAGSEGQASRNPATQSAKAPRRRGPLITRWIGFAARREGAKARMTRLALQKKD